MELDKDYVIRRNYTRLQSLIHEDEISSWRRLHLCNSRLKMATEITSVMSYFAVVAAVECNLKQGDPRPGLITAMVITTSLLVATTMVLKVICCSILPYIQSVIDISEIRDVDRSPHDLMLTTIKTTWIVACIVGPVLFILDLFLLTWIKFGVLVVEAAYAASSIMLALLVLMGAFGIVVCRRMHWRGHHRHGHRYKVLTPDGSHDELTLVSVGSNSSSSSSNSSSGSSYTSAQVSLITHSHLSRLYGSTDPSDPVILALSFSQDQGFGF